MKLKRNNILIISILAFFCSYGFSQHIAKSYINLPDKLDPTMTSKSRMELLEYHKAGKGDSIQNRFRNQAFLEVFDTLNSLIVVKNTKSSVFEMKLMKTDDEKPFIGIIHTVCAPICQSSVEFYDTAWNKLALQFILPKSVEWIDNEKLTRDSTIDKSWLKKVLSISFVSLHFESKNQEIIAKNNSFEFLSEVDRKVVSPFLINRSITYRFEGQKWVQKP